MHVPLYEDVEFSTCSDKFVNADNAVIAGVDVYITVDKFVNVEEDDVVGLDECLDTDIDIEVFLDADEIAYWYQDVVAFVVVLKVAVAVVAAVPYVDTVAYVSCAGTDGQSVPDWQQYIPEWQSESRLHRTKTAIMIIMIDIIITIIIIMWLIWN